MSFEQYLQSKDLTLTTIKHYCSEARYFEQFLHQRGTDQINATKKDILDYLKLTARPNSKGKIVEKKPLSNQYKKSILGILNHLYTYLVKTDQATHIITHFIKIRGTQRRKLRPLFSLEALHQLCDTLYYNGIDQIQPPTIQQQKDYLILTLAAFQGLQIHEIKRLQIEDFDLHKGTITIHASRKSNARKLYLEAAQIGILINYFHQNGDTQFISFNSHIEALNKKLRRLHPKYQNFHQIRASIITHWIKTHGLRKAQYLAGHRYINSTENFLHNDFEQLQKDLDNFHPLG